MVFSSLIFLYAFFPLSLLAYVLCRTKRSRNAALLIFSLVFYAWAEPKYLLLLMLMSAVSWACALQIENQENAAARKRILALCAAVDIGLIGFFKYASLFCSLFGPVPEFISRIALPIGISFYTFQLLTYVVDVYRREVTAQKRFWDVLLYAALFHQCIAGPIVRYKTIAEELFSDTPRRPELTRGITRFTVGLGKKVLLANPCGALTDTLLLSTDTLGNAQLLAENLQHLRGLSVGAAWLGVLAYGLHIYLDFSAYSDMAIGMGQMLGLHYPENFNYPYISRSVTEFWRRWHISLGTFFRDYVYIPLGGNRCTPLRVIFNTFVVWALTGLWHGASWNYLFWGLWFFLLLMAERYLLKNILAKLHLLSHVYLLCAVGIGWVIFRFSDTQQMGTLLGTLFGCNGNALGDFTTQIQLQNHLFLLIAAMVCSTPALRMLCQGTAELLRKSRGGSLVWDILSCVVVPVLLLLLSTACLVGDSYNPFLYFQF